MRRGPGWGVREPAAREIDETGWDDVRAMILAAGLGQRLERPELPPKVMLSFGGETLLARHVSILRHLGVAGVDVAVGYRAHAVEEEVAKIGAEDFVRIFHNHDYQRGSLLSLWTLRDTLRGGEPVVFMDGDVLHDHRLLERLLGSGQANCYLMDRITGEGEDPVRLCFRAGTLVDFHKRPRNAYDWWGEWIGFARFAPAQAAEIAAALARSVDAGRLDDMYEDAFREVLLASAQGTFGVEDITGLPWVEIDFPEDLARAEREIFPRLVPLPDRGRTAVGEAG